MPIPPHIQSLRQKIGHDLLFLPAVCALVFNDKNELLLGRRSDNGQWALIGGIMDPGEQPADTVVRECLEETAVLCRPEYISGVYLTPEVTYNNGDHAQYLIVAFRCTHISGTPKVNDSESLEVRYFPLSQLPELYAHHRLRIDHALAATPALAQFTPPQPSPGK